MAEHGSIRIPDHEYKERAQRAAKIIQREGLDALIVNSNEADYANARYFSGYWSLFERSGVVIAPTGEAALMVGRRARNLERIALKLRKFSFSKHTGKARILHIPNFRQIPIRMYSVPWGSQEKNCASGWPAILILPL